MVVRFKKPKWKFKRGRREACGYSFVIGSITGESYEETVHVFEIEDRKGSIHRVKGGHLYQSAEIVSLGTYGYWDNLRENFASRK